MFKKIAALGAAAALCVGLMSGCGASGTAADTSYSAENPLVLTLAHGLSETHTVHIAMTQFAEEVNEKTNGRIQVKIFPNGQLGSENENLEQLQAGVIAMTKVSAPGLATYNEAFNAFGLPYIFNDTADFYNVMDSQEMQDFFLSTGDDGFVTLTYYTSGARSFYTKDKAIRTPADLKGLKIRTMEAPLIMSTYSAWGANPVPVDFSELYSSLQQNVVDGQENPYLTISDMRFYEVQKYMTISKHAYLSYVLTFSDAFLNGLPEDLEQVVMDCGKECVQYHRDQMAELNQGYYDNIAASGIAINTLTDEQREAFKDASASVYDEYRDKIGGDLLDAVVAACAK